MITSAPQWHDQRTYSPTIANFIKYNPIMTELLTELIIQTGDIVQCLMAEESQLPTEQITTASL